MVPDGIREQFDFYRKWFQTLLVKEFLNLPSKYQERFLIIAQKFIDDCKRIIEEGKKIQEKLIEIRVDRILSPDNKEENYIVCGRAENVEDEIRLSFLINRPKPKIGSKICHTVYSLDGDVWYSSKEELITGNNIKESL